MCPGSVRNFKEVYRLFLLIARLLQTERDKCIHLNYQTFHIGSKEICQFLFLVCFICFLAVNNNDYKQPRYYLKFLSDSGHSDRVNSRFEFQVWHYNQSKTLTTAPVDSDTLTYLINMHACLTILDFFSTLHALIVCLHAELFFNFFPPSTLNTS